MSRTPYTPEEGSLAYRICLLAAADRYARLRPSNLAAKLQVSSGNIGPSARAALQHGWLKRVTEGHTFALMAGPNMPDPWPPGTTPAPPPPSHIGLDPVGKPGGFFCPASSRLPPPAPRPAVPVPAPAAMEEATKALGQLIYEAIASPTTSACKVVKPAPAAPRTEVTRAASSPASPAAFDLASVRITTAPKPDRRGGLRNMSRYDSVLERLPVGGVAEQLPAKVARGLISRMKRRGMAHSSRTNADGTISVWRES